jgi:hypothetical protein
MMKSTCSSFGMGTLAIVSPSLAMLVASTYLGLSSGIVYAQNQEPQFTTDFRLGDCDFKTRGKNPHFILIPGRQLVLEGAEAGKTIRLVVTVLPEIESFLLPDIGEVKTAVVEERESVDGVPVEISRNFFAICEKTNDVFYFGEDVDIFNPDGTISHEGSWRAGKPDADGLAKPGIVMPGTFFLGSRYYQELADGIALDQAAHVETGIEMTTGAGTFRNCVKVLETTPLEPGAETVKIYCPGVGKVVDNVVKLVERSTAPGPER